MEEFNKEAVLRRIEKLLAIAQDDRADANEAAAAARQAERTMRKYEIEYADVVMSNIKKREGMAQDTVLATALRPHEIVRTVPMWAQWIGVSLAKLMDVNATVAFKRPHKVIQFSGFASDVQIAAWQYAYLVATLNRLCTAFKETDDYKNASSQKVMNSYRMGVAHGICENLRKALADKNAENKMKENDTLQTAALTTGALIVLSKNQAVQEHFGNPNYGKGKTNVQGGDSFRQGQKDGQAVNVHTRPLGNSSATTKRIGG